ncbi:uncharacterized protein TNCV_2214881 [Trichonephila clavipes]|nr:uncharacterized protein TNCV_2214881 [Trichonephila clavipes]
MKPADHNSRRCSLSKLIESRWWEGPSWLLEPSYTRPVKELINCETSEILLERGKCRRFKSKSLVADPSLPADHKKDAAIFEVIGGLSLSSVLKARIPGATHPLISATKKVVAKFKPQFEGTYRILEVKNNKVVVWKVGKRLTINVDQVRIYRHRKCDETEIGTGSSDNNSLRYESSSFEEYNGDQISRNIVGRKGQIKKRRTQDNVAVSTNRCNLRPRGGKGVESRPAMEMKTQQGGPV